MNVIRDSSVNTVTSLRAGRPGFRFPAKAWIFFSSSHCVQTTSGAHTASQLVGVGGLRRPVREADHSPLSSADVKKALGHTSIPPIRLHDLVLG